MEDVGNKLNLLSNEYRYIPEEPRTIFKTLKIWKITTVTKVN